MFSKARGNPGGRAALLLWNRLLPRTAIVPQNVAASVQCPYCAIREKSCMLSLNFTPSNQLGGGRFFQRDSPSPPPRRLHRAFFYQK